MMPRVPGAKSELCMLGKTGKKSKAVYWMTVHPKLWKTAASRWTTMADGDPENKYPEVNFFSFKFLG
jgi:hypothetical protein